MFSAMLAVMETAIYFQGGTLVLQHMSAGEPVPEPFKMIKAHWRCEAYHYSVVRPWLRERNIRDTVPRWQRLALTLHNSREPHDYQVEALDAWKQADMRGSIILPTGAGKTFLAIHAITQTHSSTVIIVPTISLLHQWYALLVNAFQTEIGVYYSGEKHVLPITVTTYSSAGDLIAEHGNTFRLLICDEVHHLPARTWGEAALMSPATLRLGLTATYPEEHEQTNGRWRIDELLGPIVYTKRVEDLVGKQLAHYRTQRIRVNLSEDERQRYERDHALYMNFVRARRLPQTYGPRWLLELMRLSTTDTQARGAFLARQRLLQLLAHAEEKFAVLEELMQEYVTERMLIFTEYNAIAYEIAVRYLIPAITHETTAAERKHILDGFQSGRYRVIVTSRVLNEGVDVPEAKVAVVLGGTSGAREYIQRLGRVLRKVENRQAMLFEIIARKTIEEGKSQRRRKPQETH